MSNLAIIASIFASIILVALLLFALYIAQKVKKHAIRIAKKGSKATLTAKKNLTPQKKAEDVQSRNHKKELKKENEVQIMPRQADELDEENDVTVVGIVEAKGYWSAKVIREKLSFLMSGMGVMNKNDKRGFWVKMIDAQAQAQGKTRGRGRGDG